MDSLGFIPFLSFFPNDLTANECRKCRALHLRHTFAVRAFDKNERNGIKASESVPFLSTYLGHDSLYETGRKIEFMSLLEDYFETYLPYSRGLSPNTIESYKQSFMLLLRFMLDDRNFAGFFA